MSDSKQWALEALQEVNTIYEPGERGGWVQGVDFLIWCAECALIWWVASRLVAPH
jgi:hypothetical protein